MTLQHPISPDLWPDGTDRAFDLQVRRHVARARKLQAEAMAESIASVWHGLTHALTASASWLARQRRQSETRLALMACSDRTLADIGIPREHIHLAARGVDVRQPIAVSRAGPWPRPAAMLERFGFPGAEQRRIYRELMAYNDRELEEIGLRRSDIPALARAA